MGEACGTRWQEASSCRTEWRRGGGTAGVQNGGILRFAQNDNSVGMTGG